MSEQFPIGTLVMIADKSGEIGIVVDHHHIKAWLTEREENKYKTIYKVNIVSKSIYKYCYSYEMVLLSE
jgi:hypothetical protein